MTTLVGTDQFVIDRNGTLYKITATDIGTFIAVPTTLADLSEDATHRIVTDAEKSTWNSKIANVVEDTTPQLGGDLEFNGKTANVAGVRGIADATPGTGTTHTFNYTNGDMQQITAPAAGTLTLAFSNFPTGDVCGFVVDMINGGNCTLTYPTGCLFPASTEPTLTTSGTDRLMFLHDKDNVLSCHVVDLDLLV